MLEETEITTEQNSETGNEKPAPAHAGKSFGGTPKMSMPVRANPPTTTNSAEPASEQKSAASPKPDSSKSS